MTDMPKPAVGSIVFAYGSRWVIRQDESVAYAYAVLVIGNSARITTARLTAASDYRVLYDGSESRDIPPSMADMSMLVCQPGFHGAKWNDIPYAPCEFHVLPGYQIEVMHVGFAWLARVSLWELTGSNDGVYTGNQIVSKEFVKRYTRRSLIKAAHHVGKRMIQPDPGPKIEVIW